VIEENKAAVVLDNIPFELNDEKIIKQLHPHGDIQRYEKDIRELIDMVVPIAKPKAIYAIGQIGHKKEDSLEINGVTFSGSLLRDKFQNVSSVFPFVASCGREVDTLEIPAKEVLKRYCLDVIKMMLAISAVSSLQNHLIKQHAARNLASVNPGYSENWPITQLKELFSAIGNVEALIGVSLTESCTMKPLKSRAGIFFATD
jgi:hypothetical protein